jgi:hypothetical protein
VKYGWKKTLVSVGLQQACSFYGGGDVKDGPDYYHHHHYYSYEKGQLLHNK